MYYGVVYLWGASNADSEPETGANPYLPGFDGDRPDVVYPLRQLYVGMPMEEVEAAFGPPDEVHHNSTIVGSLDEDWTYCFQPEDWRIILQFDENGLIRHWLAMGVD